MSELQRQDQPKVDQASKKEETNLSEASVLDNNDRKAGLQEHGEGKSNAPENLEGRIQSGADARMRQPDDHSGSISEGANKRLESGADARMRPPSEVQTRQDTVETITKDNATQETDSRITIKSPADHNQIKGSGVTDFSNIMDQRLEAKRSLGDTSDGGKSGKEESLTDVSGPKIDRSKEQEERRNEFELPEIEDKNRPKN